MTEAEWLTCGNARTMLTFLGGKPGERKLRLFTCACWRRRWPGPAEPRSARAVEVAEQLGDGRCGGPELETAQEAAREATAEAGVALNAVTWGADRAAFRATQDRQRRAWAAEWTCQGSPFAAEHVLRLAQEGATKKQRAGCAELVREVFGNPFRAVAADPTWLTWNGGLVATLAASIYDERRFGDLGVLADALEEAGCGAGELLAHCRSPGPHVLGCWALDALIGKG